MLRSSFEQQIREKNDQLQKMKEEEAATAALLASNVTKYDLMEKAKLQQNKVRVDES